MFFSIITVSLNAEALIADTVNSTLSQTFTDFEIIVKDGGSKDGTLNNIPKDERVRIIEKPDKGIYEGMNQAIREAKGKYLIFMNCGDLFYDSTVLEAAYERLKDGEKCILYGNVYSETEGAIRSPEVIKKSRFYTSTICHQAAFIHRELFDVFGLYDEKMRICADWRFFLDAFVGGAEYRYIDKTICKYLGGGVSETPEGMRICKAEKKPILVEKFSLAERMKYNLLNTKPGRALMRLRSKLKK